MLFHIYSNRPYFYYVPDDINGKNKYYIKYLKLLKKYLLILL